MTIMRLLRLAPAALLLFGCRPTIPAQGRDAAGTQASLATDTAQARLWRTAPAASALQMAAVRPDSAMVRVPDRPPLPERSATQQADQAFDASIDAGFAFVDAPVIATPLTVVARVTAVSGEYLTLDLGQGRTVRLHARIAGAALRAQTGEQAQVFLSHSDEPAIANDRLVLRLPQDEMLYALVGDTGLVSLALPLLRVTARQVGPVQNNTAAVRVSVGGETRTLQNGETANFDNGSLTIRVMASVAVSGQAANVLPGEPFRLQLIGWRRRPQG